MVYFDVIVAFCRMFQKELCKNEEMWAAAVRQFRLWCLLSFD